MRITEDRYSPHPLVPPLLSSGPGGGATEKKRSRELRRAVFAAQNPAQDNSVRCGEYVA
jgi:hypothetical protein